MIAQLAESMARIRRRKSVEAMIVPFVRLMAGSSAARVMVSITSEVMGMRRVLP
jgi:hypothetical protein